MQPQISRTKLRKSLRAVRRVDNFHVKLRAVNLALLVGDRREGRALARCNDAETRRNGADAVAMAHPHLVALARLPDAVEERVRCLHLDIGAAEFAMIGRLDLAAKLVADRLFAIANAEDRKTARVNSVGRLGRGLFMDAGRAARQDDALEARPGKRLLGGLEGDDFRIDPGFADAAGDELGELGAEIDDQNTVLHGEPIKETPRNRQAGATGLNQPSCVILLQQWQPR